MKRKATRESSILLSQLIKQMSNLKKHLHTLCAAGLYFSWILAITVSSFLFVSEIPLIFSNVFYAAFAIGFIALSLLDLFRLRTAGESGTHIAGGTIKPVKPIALHHFYLSAMLSAAVIAEVLIFRLLQSQVSILIISIHYILIGIFTGVSLNLFFQAITTALRQVERKGVITFFALTLSLAVIVFLLVSWLIVAENQLYGWLLLLTAACIAYYKSTESRQTHVKQDISDPAVAFYPTPLSPPPKSINKVLGFVLLSSFSLGFLLGQFPRTLHFAGLIANNKNLTGVITDTYLGLVGSAPLLALVSTSFVLFIVGITVMQKTFYPTPILLIALLLIIGVSVIVPQYNASPIIVLAPIAVTSLLVSSQLYLSTLFVILPYREAASRALVAATVAGAGFLIAVVMSIPHTLFPVSGDSPRQIGIYTFMIGMTAASFVVFVLFRRHLTWLYFSISDLREPLDTSSLHGSCNALASQYGLTKRETEVLEFLAIGRDGPYIQKALCISRNTFKSHSLHIYQKLGITSKQALLDLLHKNQD